MWWDTSIQSLGDKFLALLSAQPLAESTINSYSQYIYPKFRSMQDDTRLSMTQERSAPGPDELPFWLNSFSDDREDRNTTLVLLTCHNLWLKRLDGLQLKWNVSKDLLINRRPLQLIYPCCFELLCDEQFLSHVFL